MSQRSNIKTMESEDYQTPPTTDETETKNRSLSKTETLKLIRQSIRQLETIVARLDVAAESELPVSSSIR